MTNTNNNIDDLEQQVNELLDLCARLTKDNKSLRSSVSELHTERSTLIAQKDKAKTHIEDMITRLKTLENNP